MTTSIKQRLANRPDSTTKRISQKESAHIVSLNPGPGIPLSMLSSDIQQRLRDGQPVSEDDWGYALLKKD